jgi:alkylresorcinol/alkylpyrone synthase
MYLHALATALPTHSFTQAQCWEILRESGFRHRLSRRSLLILLSVLNKECGVHRRHFCIGDIARLFESSADELNECFRREAPRLAARALDAALAKADFLPSDVDALLICTCTGYLCPGLTSYVSELLGLKPNAFLQDLVGLGCGAAIPTLRTAQAILAQEPRALVACIAVEVCSAAFYLDDDLGVLLSACLFGDGAAASLWRAKPAAQLVRCDRFTTLHIPQERDRIRFEQRDGKLRNLLHPTVPELAAKAVARLYAVECERPNAEPIRRIIAHPGGRDVLTALSTVLPPEFSLEESLSTLRNHGNMSSPSVLFGLDEALRKQRPTDGDWWLVSFGAGFSAHSCRIS